MKAFLMHRDRDFDAQAELPPNARDLIQDLELDTLFDAMARGDKLLLAVARTAILSSLTDLKAIEYRQDIVRDCLEHPEVVRQIYDVAVGAVEAQRKIWRSRYSADGVLRGGVEVMQVLVGFLKRLRLIADEHRRAFRSEGFVRFFDMLVSELDDQYFGVVEDHLRRLAFRDGVLMSAALGKGAKGAEYVLRKPWPDTRGWMDRLLAKGPPSYSYQVADRDEAGHQALELLRRRGINLVANALAQSTDHVVSFFRMLQTELAFYVGCLNLHEQLMHKAEPACIPAAVGLDQRTLSTEGLYDVCLTLKLEGRAVGNDVAADGKGLVMITGANQGGKSTFLRSVGLAQLMMQCGMFVGAAHFCANVCDGLFTHYKREEDPTMKSGKFDEELGRMSQIADRLGPNCLVLCNESFASTNEREGSEIARQIVHALLEARVKVFYVTHLYDLARSFHQAKPETALFLRAGREVDGRRTFRLVEGEPLPTSHGRDVYLAVFGANGHAGAQAASELEVSAPGAEQFAP
ncbi:MAG: DNA mismatch repair protein MutS [Chloroflexota bacterium]|nr:DNA mismatch repair protein MutS [Chloroflexota bacterium]